MAMFTDEEAAMIRRNMPVMGNRPPGVDIVAKLETLFTESAAATANLALLISGSATVLNGTTSITVTEATLGGAYGGKPAQVAFAEAPGAADDLSYAWSGDDLVITIDTDNLADLDVTYFVDAR